MVRIGLKMRRATCRCQGTMSGLLTGDFVRVGFRIGPLGRFPLERRP
jgi:hypothetical protein